jgi:hypothetical protein
MNFYTSIFNPKSPRKWILKSLFGAFGFIAFIFGFNYVIDPYSATSYNLLDIKQKFARDDRNGKINTLREMKAFDNIMFGSSRVYSINPLVVTKLVGGTTYNLGVSGACVEDHLGMLLWLKKNNKLPKRLIIGVDFYTFNPEIPPKSHFLENEELNFLSYSNNKNEYWAKFLSIDATRASIKTFKNHLKNKKEKPRFDKFGWNAEYRNDTNRNFENEIIGVKNEVESIRKTFYSNFKYQHIDKKRIEYYEQIRAICKENNIELYIFTTPLHPILLQTLNQHLETKNALKEFQQYLKTFENFENFYIDEEFTNNLYNFEGATHTTPNAGDLILKKILR